METLHYALLTLTFGYSLCQGAAMPLAGAKRKLSPALMMQNIAKHRKAPVKTTEELKKEQVHAIIAKNASNNCIIVRHTAKTDPIHIAGSHVPAIIQLIKSYWGTHDLLDNVLRPAFATTETLKSISWQKEQSLYDINGKLTECCYKNNNDTFVITKQRRQLPVARRWFADSIDERYVQEEHAYRQSDTDRKTWNEFIPQGSEFRLIINPQGISKNVCRMSHTEPQHNSHFNLFYTFENEINEKNNKVFTGADIFFFENGIIITVNRHNSQIKIWDISESQYEQRSSSINDHDTMDSFATRHNLDLDSSDSDDFKQRHEIYESLKKIFKFPLPYTEINGYLSCYCIQTIDYSNTPFTSLAIDSNNPYCWLITTQQSSRTLYTQNQGAMAEIIQSLTIDDLVQLKALIQKLNKLQEDMITPLIHLEEADRQFFYELPTNIRLTLLQNYPRLAV